MSLKYLVGLKEFMEEFEVNHIGISGAKKFSSDDDAIQKMSELRKMETPDYFVEQTVNLEADDREETVLIFSDRGSNHLTIGLGNEEGVVSFHFSFNSENIEPSKTLLETIVEILEGIEVEDFHIALEYNVNFEDFDLELESNKIEDLKFVGVRLRSDETDYIVQKEEEEKISVMARYRIQSLQLPMEENFIQEQIETSKDFLLSLHNE